MTFCNSYPKLNLKFSHLLYGKLSNDNHLVCSDERVTILLFVTISLVNRSIIFPTQHSLKSSLSTHLSLISVNTCMNPSNTEGS